MITFIYLPLILFLFHPTSKYSEPGYIEHLRTLNTFSFPVSVQCRQVPLYSEVLSTSQFTIFCNTMLQHVPGLFWIFCYGEPLASLFCQRVGFQFLPEGIPFVVYRIVILLYMSHSRGYVRYAMCQCRSGHACFNVSFGHFCRMCSLRYFLLRYAGTDRFVWNGMDCKWDHISCCHAFIYWTGTICFGLWMGQSCWRTRDDIWSPHCR